MSGIRLPGTRDLTDPRPGALALSKTMDPRDYQALTGPRNLVLLHGGADLAAQHEARVWEYSMALEAYRRWLAELVPVAGVNRLYRVLDVGGAGSPLAHLFRQTGATVDICDPTVNQSVETLVATLPRGATGFYDVITSISTIEHVPAPGPFLRALVALLAPGGLLFLTTDFWDSEGPDTAHFHWMRARIYNRTSWDRTYKVLRGLGLNPFGGVDHTYYGHQLFGSYTFCSLCLVKESR